MVMMIYVSLSKYLAAYENIAGHQVAKKLIG